MHFDEALLLEKAKVLSGVAVREDFSPVARLGALNALKGKYFELWVHCVLNEKKAAGALYLAENECVILAESHVQAGWDLKIINLHENTASFWQLKATRSTAYVYKALLKYPHYKVLATSEVAQKMEKNKRAHTAIKRVWDSGVKNADLENYLAVRIFNLPLEAFFEKAEGR